MLKPVRKVELQKALALQDACTPAKSLDILVAEHKTVNQKPAAPLLETPGHTLVLDRSELMSRIDHDRGLLLELVEMFRTNSPRLMRSMHDAVASNDPEAMAYASHTLRGSLANFAAGPAVNVAGELEAMGRAGDLSGASLILERLALELELVKARLDSLCSEASA